MLNANIRILMQQNFTNTFLIVFVVFIKVYFCEIARVIFYVEDNTIILLHGFIKKSQATPQKELDTAIKRYKDILSRKG